MPISTRIRAAVEATFPAEQQTQVLEGLATIPEADSEPLRSRPSAESLQAAVLVLANGDLEVFHRQLMNARIEPRDVTYVLQSPGAIRPGLTTAELVRRYHALDLPVDRVLDLGAHNGAQ